MDSKYIGWQKDTAVFIANTKEELEHLPCVSLSHITEVESAELIENKVIVGEEIQAKKKEIAFAGLRNKRDALLSATDYAAMPDYPLAADKKAALMTYRQALRDLPSQPGAPWDGGGTETPWPVNPLDAQGDPHV